MTRANHRTRQHTIPTPHTNGRCGTEMIANRYQRVITECNEQSISMSHRERTLQSRIARPKYYHRISTNHISATATTSRPSKQRTTRRRHDMITDTAAKGYHASDTQSSELRESLIKYRYITAASDTGRRTPSACDARRRQHTTNHQQSKTRHGTSTE